jgi:predicted metalloprotease with PDZ domain
MSIGAISAIAILVARRTKMHERTRKSYDDFARALWEAHFEQSRRRHAAQDAEDTFKAASLAWQEAAAPEIIGNLGRSFYEKIPITRFKP